MRHYASPAFWRRFETLPQRVQQLALNAYQLLKDHPRHPSLRFKKIGRYFSVRIGLRYRALGVEAPDGILWYWIGTHADYDKLLG